MNRRPMAVANWKMSLSVSESIRFLDDFLKISSSYLDHLDVILCPAYTAIWPVKKYLEKLGGPGRAIQLAAQNIAPGASLSRTGEISAELARDAGCTWVLVGHWEIRRRYGETDEDVNKKVHLSLSSDLKPILLTGESRDNQNHIKTAVENHLAATLAEVEPEDIASMAFIYEPESVIGAEGTAPVEHLAIGCQAIRSWLTGRYGSQVASQVRILYGGGVTPANATNLMQVPELDGLGASRKGRVADSFFEIIRNIRVAKAGS